MAPPHDLRAAGPRSSPSNGRPPHGSRSRLSECDHATGITAALLRSLRTDNGGRTVVTIEFLAGFSRSDIARKAERSPVAVEQLKARRFEQVVMPHLDSAYNL